jgi:hypothetical protein
MYTAPRYRPGGEEGDDTMDASGYLSALGGMGNLSGGWTDALKDIGKQAGKAALQSSLAKANAKLGGGGAKQIAIAPEPPMSTGKKVFLAALVAVPAIYFLTSMRRKPATVSNPRRRRRSR